MSHQPPAFFLAGSFYAGEDCLLNLGWVATKGCLFLRESYPRRADLSANMTLSELHLRPHQWSAGLQQSETGIRNQFLAPCEVGHGTLCHGDNTAHAWNGDVDE